MLRNPTQVRQENCVSSPMDKQDTSQHIVIIQNIIHREYNKDVAHLATSCGRRLTQPNHLKNPSLHSLPFYLSFIFFIVIRFRFFTQYQSSKVLTSNFDLSTSASHKPINPIPSHHSKKKKNSSHSQPLQSFRSIVSQPSSTNHYHKIRDLPSIYKTEEKLSRYKQTRASTRGNYPRKHSLCRRSYQVQDLPHPVIKQQK